MSPPLSKYGFGSKNVAVKHDSMVEFNEELMLGFVFKQLDTFLFLFLRHCQYSSQNTGVSRGWRRRIR